MEDVMRDIRKLKDRQDDLSDSLNKLSDKVSLIFNRWPSIRNIIIMTFASWTNWYLDT